MKKLVLLNVFVAVLSISFFTGNAMCMTGKELAQLVYDRYIGLDSKAISSMKLINKKGKERVRNFTVLTIKNLKGFIRQKIRFLSPADIRGTGFLTIEKAENETYQFLFLPALKRTRMVVSSDGGRFVNTDFTYEDMKRRPVEYDDHKIVGRGIKGGTNCYILESRPKEKAGSQYSLIKNWITKEYVPIYTELYNKKRGKLIKIYEATELKKIQEIWTVVKATMRDINRRHETIIILNNITYNSGLHEKLFTKRYLGKTGR